MTIIQTGGSALPVSVVTGRPIISTEVLPVRSVVNVSDGRGVEGSPTSQPVVYLSASDLDVNGGKYHLVALPSAMQVVSGHALTPNGGPALAVYEVSDPYPVPYIPPVPPTDFPPITTGLILDLQATALSLSDGDPVSMWADASGLGHDFTAAGAARPAFHAGTPPYIQGDGNIQYLDGGNFADNLASFTVLLVVKALSTSVGFTANMIVKGDVFSQPYWAVGAFTPSMYIWQDGSNYRGGASDGSVQDVFFVLSAEYVGGHVALYRNGAGSTTPDEAGTVTNYATSGHVVLLQDGDGDMTDYPLAAVMIYSPALSAPNRATMEAAIASKYGIML